MDRRGHLGLMAFVSTESRGWFESWIRKGTNDGPKSTYQRDQAVLDKILARFVFVQILQHGDHLEILPALLRVPHEPLQDER